MEIIIWLVVIVVAFVVGDRVGAAILEIRRLKRLHDERTGVERR